VAEACAEAVREKDEAIAKVEASIADRLQDALHAAEASHTQARTEALNAAEMMFNRRLEEALAGSRQDAARRLDDALVNARQEASRLLEDSMAAVRAEQGAQIARAVAETKMQLAGERDAAVAAVRAELEGSQFQARSLLAADDRAEQSVADLERERAEFRETLERERAEFTAATERARAEAAEAIEAVRRMSADEIDLVRRGLTEELETARAQAKDAVEAARRDTQDAVEAARGEQASLAAQSQLDARVDEREHGLAQVSRINESVQRIGGARSLTDVLDALAESAAKEAPRVALFVLRASRLTGWRHSGFPADVDPSRLELSVEQGGLLTRALKAGRAVASSEGQAGEPAFASPFGMLPDNAAGLAVPVRLGGETVAVVYADDDAPGPAVPNVFPEVIEVLASYAGRCLEVLTFARAAAQAPAARPPVRPAPPVAPTPVTPPQAPSAAAQAFAPVVPVFESQPTVLPSPVLPIVGPPPMADAPPPRYAPVTRAFPSSGDEDEDAARRYARLLVSEIKLYHEGAVAEGRRNRNLLERLRPEIERAHRLYEERVPVQVRLKSDFFGQELVRTLAGGDPTLLGAR
jgi:hypothetical protein